MTEPLLTLPISKIEIYQHQHQRQRLGGEIHIVIGWSGIFAKPAICKLLATDISPLTTHHLVISGGDDLTVRVPIATQEEADQLSELLAKLQAESASHD